MIHALRSLKPQPPRNLVPSPFRTQTGREPISSLRFIQATPNSKHEEKPSKMENQHDKKPVQPEKTEDAMSHSFGDGYKTRSDEEGFGGIYAGNQSDEEIDVNHVLHPEYDTSQGSEVKEKEKGRNQLEASS